MSRQIVNGNEALALGALRAGVRVVTGYPGTPSTRALASLLAMDLKDVYTEWSTNEKVALEIASGAAWAGQRALCTMKMSGLNVAYDSLISIAYSGTVGGLVIYVADDPGVSAGMAEQDSRGFALMSDLPMLEPASVEEVYQQVQMAFEISEQVGAPVFIRLVTAMANSKTVIDLQEVEPHQTRPAILTRDISKYTKAGAVIAMTQHRDLIARLEKAGEIIDALPLNILTLAEKENGLGIVASGATAAYVEEGLEIAVGLGLEREAVSLLKISAVNPFPAAAIKKLLEHTSTLLVLEELEPYIERNIYVEAYRLGLKRRIIGKLDGTFSRIGDYHVSQVVKGIIAALNLPAPEDLLQGHAAESVAAQRPITVCAGCPHRGTFMAINRAIKNLKFKKDEVMVTGDIGCTILGMNPPFNTVWNEVSMGASIGLAQGYVHGGVQTPVIATMGDSTFFHAGIPGLINAVQHQVNLTLIIMDNGWTGMTGMQVNAGTAQSAQKPGSQSVDIASIIPALGVKHYVQVDPFDFPTAVAAIQEALTQPGVKVILARRECAIQARRAGKLTHRTKVDYDKCILCKWCITNTGCPALSIEEGRLMIDADLCTGCGMCVTTCNHDALTVEPCL